MSALTRAGGTTVPPILIPKTEKCYNSSMKYLSKNIDETRDLARYFVENLEPKERATVVALIGDLGSSKTTFSQLVGEALGVRDGIQSPTFLIEKIYELFNMPWKHLVHIDAYRLDDPQELLALGWEDIVARPENLILIEWADKVKSILPEDAVFISFTFVDETTRKIEISLPTLDIHEN